MFSKRVVRDRLIQCIAVMFVLCVGLGIGVLIGRASANTLATAGTGALRNFDAGYPHIDPLIACSVTDSKQHLTKETQEVEQALTQEISHQKHIGYISEASVYFQDLNLGRSVGINEYATYTPASLLKVPIMIFYGPRLVSRVI